MRAAIAFAAQWARALLQRAAAAAALARTAIVVRSMPARPGPVHTLPRRRPGPHRPRTATAGPARAPAAAAAAAAQQARTTTAPPPAAAAAAAAAARPLRIRLRPPGPQDWLLLLDESDLPNGLRQVGAGVWCAELFVGGPFAGGGLGAGPGVESRGRGQDEGGSRHHTHHALRPGRRPRLGRGVGRRRRRRSQQRRRRARRRRRRRIGGGRARRGRAGARSGGQRAGAARPVRGGGRRGAPRRARGRGRARRRGAPRRRPPERRAHGWRRAGCRAPARAVRAAAGAAAGARGGRVCAGRPGRGRGGGRGAAARGAGRVAGRGAGGGRGAGAGAGGRVRGGAGQVRARGRARARVCGVRGWLGRCGALWLCGAPERRAVAACRRRLLAVARPRAGRRPTLPPRRCPPLPARLIHALASLRARPPRPWLDAFCRASAPRLACAPPRHLAAAAWALARLGHAPPRPWVGALLEGSERCMGAAGAQALGNIAWALGTWRCDAAGGGRGASGVQGSARAADWRGAGASSVHATDQPRLPVADSPPAPPAALGPLLLL